MMLTDRNKIQPGCYVKIVNGLFSGFYATITNKSYGDELEINYFQKQYGKWILKDGDLDSCDVSHDFGEGISRRLFYI